MSKWNKPRIAVLFPGALGDFICLLPTLHALAVDARVEIFAKTEFADIVAPEMQLSALERYEINRLYVAGAAFERQVQDFFSAYDYVYSWMGEGVDVFASELGRLAPGRALLFAFRGASSANSTMHQVDYYLSCLGLSPSHSPVVKIPLRPEAIQWSEAYCDGHGLKEKSVLVLAPGSGAREKNWPAAYFSVMARWWRERTRGEAIVLLGPVEQERGGCDRLADDFISARNLNLGQVAALLSRGDLYIGNDSGMTHLAAAIGVPTVALFGPSDERRWVPRGAKVLLLRLGVACSPCDIQAMKSCAHHNCLAELLPEKVIEELEKLRGIASLTRLEAGITVHDVSRLKKTNNNAG
jgi:ADP-heptose:LPS heptosyltransferase